MKENTDQYMPVLEILDDIFDERRYHNDYKCQVTYDCPVCSYEIKGLDHGDGKGNLEVNYRDEVFQCWSCSETHETHGTLYKLIKSYGNTKQLKKYLLLRPDKAPDAQKRAYKRVSLPKEYIAFESASNGLKMTPQFKQAWNYIKKRNITDEQIKKFKIGFCYSGLYENRIIITSFDKNDEVNYFIARSYLTKTKRKYMNPEAEKEIIIFNEKLIDWNKPVYLVEGVFDHIFLDNSIPMLGKHLSDLLFQMLYDNAKEIIIVLDGDAYSNAVKLFHEINCGKLMNKVWIVKLPEDKDIADLQGDLREYNKVKLD